MLQPGSICSQRRRVIVGHHGVDDRAVLAAVQASALRTDRSAAAGLDRVCAQRMSEPLRDGRRTL